MKPARTSTPRPTSMPADAHHEQCDPAPKGPCAESVETIRNLFESLRSSIARAEQKLAPALSLAPELDDGKPMPSGHSELHGALLDFEDELRRAIVSVDLLADRSTL